MSSDTVGFFGGMDAEAIGTNPFYTADDTYPIVCVGADVKKKEDGTKQLVVGWAIDDPESEYHGNRLSQYFNLLDWPTSAKAAKDFWEKLDAKEKKSQKFLNKLLTEGFDLTPAEIKTLDPKELVGREAMGKVVNGKYNDKETGEEKTSTNLQNVVSRARFHGNREEAEASNNAKFGI